ncbi:MAG TPA: glycosyltransferase, partial [Bacteroidia bacterium]|nr:glycosyltransferase [Bacteroidia bacterium]
MRICYLGDAPSIHTQRWCSYFVSLGHEVHLVTFRDAKIAGVEVHFINAGPIKSTGGNWRVLLKATKVKRLLEKIKPDILHAHYATSYGAVGARTGFHPYIITPHGTDVLITPWKSRVYRWLLRNTFKSADLVLIVADHMREAVQRLGV